MDYNQREFEISLVFLGIPVRFLKPDRYAGIILNDKKNLSLIPLTSYLGITLTDSISHEKRICSFQLEWW